MPSKADRLRTAIRSGAADCPDRGARCDRNMARHAPDCKWQRAIEDIYRLE